MRQGRKSRFSLLGLLSCATITRAPLPAGGIIRSLESNLAKLVPLMNAHAQRVLAANLLNGRIQFLNTLSEFGLARYYFSQAWQVGIAVPLPNGGKDVDLHLLSPHGERWLDVLNAAPNEWQGDGFAPVTPPDLEYRLVEKVVDKFESKFRTALARGWKKPAWIALDFTKNDGIAMAVTVLGLIGSSRLEDFATEVLRRCPEMAGLAYFTYRASEPQANWIQEFPR